VVTPLGTLDRTPPPFFRQGPSALTKLMFCSALAVFLMVADTRFKITRPLRTVVATVLNPVERALGVPVDVWNGSGDYLMGLTFSQSPVDMSSCGGPTAGTLRDFELQELSPNGDLVWSWLASKHIPLTEVTARWQSQCATGGDIYHWNSVEPDGDGYVLSFRHLDAVYRINRGTGAIDWKLGGASRPESLTVVDDPLSAVGTFCGQHDARVLADGSLTVFDNGTGCNRPSRAVRFAIDDTTALPTATLLEDIRDSDGAGADCCGSTRRSSCRRRRKARSRCSAGATTARCSTRCARSTTRRAASP